MRRPPGSGSDLQHFGVRSGFELARVHGYRQHAVIPDGAGQLDESFIAEVPELSGCAVDGATYREALASAEVVIQEWIDTARELGRPIPEPRGKLMFAEME